MFSICEFMYSNWKYKLSHCKNTYFSRFHKINHIVFRSIHHNFKQNIPVYLVIFATLCNFASSGLETKAKKRYERTETNG